LWFKEETVALAIKELLDMPIGSPKPRKDCSIGQKLRNYTKIGGKSYRSEFHAEIKNRHPNWFEGKWYETA
jgi:hypothetical protein